MVFAEDIRKTILKLADERGVEKTFEPEEVARFVDQDNWKMLIEQVKFVASVLVQEGKIVALHSGKAVDPATTQCPLCFKKSA